MEPFNEGNVLGTALALTTSAWPLTRPMGQEFTGKADGSQQNRYPVSINNDIGNSAQWFA